MTELYELPCPNCNKYTIFRHDSKDDGFKIFSFKCEFCGCAIYLWKNKNLRRKQVDQLTKGRAW